MADGLTWGGYSLIQRDIPIMAGEFFQLITSILIVALKLTNKARLQKQGSFSRGLVQLVINPKGKKSLSQ